MASRPDDPIRAALEQVIGFQYEIIGLVGRGGMGAVYRAHERALDRPVAIKVLPPEVATAEGRERFLREARTAARLTHPNIVPLHTFGDTGSLIYFVMGYVDGESLEQRLRRTGALDPIDATRILQQLASALDYAHRQGVVHRDVKPDNVLLERGTGNALLTDFGIAKQGSGAATLTGTGLLLGTPRYMSPEQASGDREIDGRSDIYSLGLVGYAMLTGRPPFDAATVQEILAQQVTREPAPISRAAAHVPSQLAAAIDRSLKKHPADRYRSAADLAASLSEDDDDGAAVLNMDKPGGYAMATTVLTVLSFDAMWAAYHITDEGSLVWGLALFPIGAAIDYAVARWKYKRNPEEIRRLQTEPPKRWRYWWPRSWRRRGDVWDRLPADMRRTRAIASAGVYTFFGALQLTALTLPVGNALDTMGVIGVVLAGILGGYVGALGLLVTASVRVARWAKRHGVSFEEANVLHSQPTGSPSYWTKPKFARLLEPDHRGREPQGVADLAAAIVAASRELADLQGPLAVEAGAAAGNLAATIDRLDVEIVALTRDADPAEQERLRDRLQSETLGEEMRNLYRSQLELLQRIAHQRDALSARRARYAELLRTLWLQVSSLRALQASEGVAAADITDRIRGICRSVDHEIAGVREAAALAPAATDAVSR